MIHVTGFTSAAAAMLYRAAVSAAIENSKTPPITPAKILAASVCLASHDAAVANTPMIAWTKGIKTCPIWIPSDCTDAFASAIFWLKFFWTSAQPSTLLPPALTCSAMP